MDNHFNEEIVEVDTTMLSRLGLASERLQDGWVPAGPEQFSRLLQMVYVHLKREHALALTEFLRLVTELGLTAEVAETVAMDHMSVQIACNMAEVVLDPEFKFDLAE
jgi:hypothetical protein